MTLSDTDPVVIVILFCLPAVHIVMYVNQSIKTIKTIDQPNNALCISCNSTRRKLFMHRTNHLVFCQNYYFHYML